jgi:TolB-like protein/tetratricopeptide (TPR) repeat protein
VKIIRELRRRRVFRLAGVYIVGAWVTIEVSSVFFPAWGIPDTALRYLFIAAALLFPVALVFSWVFDITAQGIVRTEPAEPGEHVDLSLRRGDWVLLAALSIIAVVVLYGSLQRVADEALLEPVAEVAERIENSIAVLPFTNLDPNPDTGYFSDGVSEEILHRLSATRALHVLGWASAKILGQSEVAPAEISARLGVEYLLHGSIRRDGNFVRVTARLMDRSGLQVWSQSFDRKLESIFVIQSEIASAVTSQIVEEIVSSGGRSVARATDNMDAYNEYLVGRALTHEREAGWHEKSEAAFRRAIELDPEYAPAYAGLAYSLFIMTSGSEEQRTGAMAAAQKSLELDPDLALGRAMLGIMEGSMGFSTLEDAEKSLRRALELDPALSDAYTWLALNLREQGRLDEADALAEQGYQIDPLLPSLANGVANERANHGDYDGAMRALEPLVRLNRISGALISGLVVINNEYGRYAEAIRADTGSSSVEAYAALGLFDEAKQLADGIDHFYFRFRAMRMNMQFRGEYEEALAFTESFLDEHGYVFEELGPNDQAWILQTQALGGDYEGAIERFGSLGNGEPLAWIENVSAFSVPGLLNAMGFAYAQIGDSEAARSVLSVETTRLAHFKPYSTPIFLMPMAQNAALLGDTDLAYERLLQAVDKGWAGYYRAVNDPRWGDVLLQPRFVKLLERVQADLEEQRAEVEAMLQEAE